MGSIVKDDAHVALDVRLAAIVLDEVRAVARERARRLTLDTRVRELGLDSLEFLDVIGRIERSCGVRLSDTDALAIESCRDIAKAVVRQRAQPPATSAEIPSAFWQFDQTAEYLNLHRALAQVEVAGERDPFFAVHEGVSDSTT